MVSFRSINKTVIIISGPLPIGGGFCFLPVPVPVSYHLKCVNGTHIKDELNRAFGGIQRHLRRLCRYLYVKILEILFLLGEIA
jgi:hypothetical protein